MTSVHWEESRLKAKAETDGHGDTCGPIVVMDYLNVKDPANWPMTNARLDQLRAELISLGFMNVGNEAGMTITQIDAALRHYGVTPVKVVPYDANLSQAQFHSDLILSLVSHQMVIYETSKAFALPRNQGGVQYHFVLVGGIDSTAGYWVANGDTVDALQSQTAVDPTWVGIGPIEASGPCGYIVLPSLDVVVTPPPPPPPMILLEKDATGAIIGAHDRENNLHIGAGFAQAMASRSWLMDHIVVGEHGLEGTATFAVVSNANGPHAVMTFTPKVGVVVFNDADLATLMNALDSDYNKLLHTPPPPKPNYSGDVASLQAELAKFESVLKTNGEL